MDTTPETVALFERLYRDALAAAAGETLSYTLSTPKWQFLCYLCDHHEIVLHGSGRPDIREFEPRKSNDAVAFGNRRAVYAASDGIWPIYFAVMNRDGPVTSLVNTCLRFVETDGSRSEPYYFFSINADALPRGPFRRGTIYLLPRQTFERQTIQPFEGRRIESEQWASLVPARPIARLPVEPDDFPFLTSLQVHDPGVLRERIARDPDGFPWLEC